MELGMFDNWASTFGETITALELSPEGSSYRMKTRFANFFNLPELMSVFQEVADIQTADMLKLPVPEAEYENIVLPASEQQKEILQSLAERAELVRNGAVDPSEDNMLKITTDGRKLALDQRLLNDMLPDTENNKVSACAERCFTIWEETKGQKAAQLVFCDSSTPKKDGTFNVYDALKEKLMEFRKKRSHLSMMPIRMYKKQDYSLKCVPGRSVFYLVPRQKWVLVLTSRTD